MQVYVTSETYTWMSGGDEAHVTLLYSVVASVTVMRVMIMKVI